MKTCYCINSIDIGDIVLIEKGKQYNYEILDYKKWNSLTKLLHDKSEMVYIVYYWLGKMTMSEESFKRDFITYS